MAFGPFTGGRHVELPEPSHDWKTEYRARVAHAESERLELKRRELLEQVSERNTPAERIRIWERRHGLTLPHASNHRLLGIVAAATGLALHQVSEEQQLRSAGVRSDAGGRSGD